MMTAVLAAILLASPAGAAPSDNAKPFADIANLEINSPDGIYAKGDTVRISADFTESFPEGIYTILALDGQEVARDTLINVQEGRSVLFEQAFDKPQAAMLYVRPVGQDECEQLVGFAVAPEEFRPGFQKPGDFKRFWRRQIRRMRRTPMRPVLQEVPLDGEDAGRFVCYHVTVQCGGSRPCRGYMAMPRNAARKSLPIYIYMHSAGLKRPGNRSSIGKVIEMAGRGGGAIAMDINAHGLPDDKDQEYYDDLDEGRLSRYAWRVVTDHESFYFRTMYLRLVRGLDFLCSLGEWDGKRVLVQGASQGGAQAAALAGLDKRVKAAVLTVPSMFDIGSALSGRSDHWKFPVETNPLDNPHVVEVAPYYDSAFMIESSDAELFVEIGLIDGACTTDCVYAGINLHRGRHQVWTYPFKPHGDPSAHYVPDWQERIVSRRQEFIDHYLQ